MENLKGTLSDRGHAILAAVARRSDLGHQSDVFHCMHTVKKELLKVEKKCYGLITKEEQARVHLEKCKATGKSTRKSAARLRRAKETCVTAVECFDNLEQAIDMAFDALRLSTMELTSTMRKKPDRLWILSANGSNVFILHGRRSSAHYVIPTF